VFVLLAGGCSDSKRSGPVPSQDSVKKEFTIGGAGASQSQKERAKARVQLYRDWLNKIVGLHDRLQTARSNNWLQDDSNATNVAKWGVFARQFDQDHRSYLVQLKEIEPVGARLMFASLLGDVLHMFHATAVRRQQDYNKDSARYAESLKELEKFVADAEATP